MLKLDGKWKLYPIEKSGSVRTPAELIKKKAISATVPGNVELDLIAAGELPEDIFKGENVVLAEKYELYDWWYETSFITPGYERDLVIRFDGVDCIAEYWLNGRKFGTSDNALVEYEFNISDYIKPEGEENILHVYIKSAVVEANHKDYDFYLKKGSWPWSDGMMIRKAPHAFGWDIMPRAVSAGIWKDVAIYENDVIGIKQLYYRLYNTDKTNGGIFFFWELDIPDDLLGNDMYVEFIGKCGESEFYAKDKVRFKADGMPVIVENVKRWWPYGYGEAALYDVRMNVLLKGEVASTKKIKIGFRDVVLERTPVKDGKIGEFRFIVNGVKIMCRGTNWVPLSPYHSQDKERYKKALPLLSEIGCNIVRCWGGNVYEQDEFYDYCDRNGIMVWQDFSMACMAYSQHDDFCKAIEDEAVKVVRRLRTHPSIVLWCGDNECDFGLDVFGTPPSQNRLTREVIPRVLQNNEYSSRPYIPSSQCIDEMCNFDREKCAEDHIWGNREYHKSDFYVNSKARFLSEIGYLSTPSEESVKKFIDEDFLWPYENNEQWILHSSNQRNNPKQIDVFIVDTIRHFFGEVPDNLSDFCIASQIVQAEAMKFFMERVRTDRERFSGIMLWNLLDGWPQMSTGMVDFYFDKKLSFDYVKRSQTPFVIFMGEQQNWSNPLIAANDTLDIKHGTYKVFDVESEEVIAEGEFEVQPNETLVLDEIKMNTAKQNFYVIEWVVDGEKSYNHYLCGMPGFDLKKYCRWLNRFNSMISMLSRKLTLNSCLTMSKSHIGVGAV